MPIQTGQQAPDFTLFSDKNEPWTLSEQDKATVLLFFPGAFTSVCTAELCTVNDDMSRYNSLGANVVGISTDSPFTLAKFKAENGFSFPLLSDHDGSVSEQYGAKYNHDFTPMKLDRISKRAAFVVRADGTVAYAEVLDNAGEQPDFDAVKSALEA
jgi:peroxiredoxin